GAVLEAQIEVVEPSNLGADGHFSMSLGTGGNLQIRNPDQLTFVSTVVGAQGKFSLSAPVISGSLCVGMSGKLPITSDQIQFSIATSGNLQFSGKAAGQLKLGTGMIPFGGSMLAAVSKGTVRFDDLTFSSSTGLTGPLEQLTVTLGNSEPLQISQT